MALIDTHGPSLLASLHNAEVGDDSRLPRPPRAGLVSDPPPDPGHPRAVDLPRHARDGLGPTADRRHLPCGRHQRLDRPPAGQRGTAEARVRRNSSAAYASRRGALALVPYPKRRTGAIRAHRTPLRRTSHWWRRWPQAGRTWRYLSVVLSDALAPLDGNVHHRHPIPSREPIRSWRSQPRPPRSTCVENRDTIGGLTVAGNIPQPPPPRPCTCSAYATAVCCCGPSMTSVGRETPTPVVRSAHRRLDARYRSWCAEAREDAQQVGLVRTPSARSSLTQYGADPGRGRPPRTGEKRHRPRPDS